MLDLTAAFLVNRRHLTDYQLTVHLVLSADLNLLSFSDVQEEVGGLLSCEMTKIHIIYLREEQLQNETLLLRISPVLYRSLLTCMIWSPSFIPWVYAGLLG